MDVVVTSRKKSEKGSIASVVLALCPGTYHHMPRVIHEHKDDGMKLKYFHLRVCRHSQQALSLFHLPLPHEGCDAIASGPCVEDKEGYTPPTHAIFNRSAPLPPPPRFLNTSVQTNREQQVNDFKRRVQLEIKERKDKETARLAAHKKKRSDEKIARRSTILKFWGKAEVGL